MKNDEAVVFATLETMRRLRAGLAGWRGQSSWHDANGVGARAMAALKDAEGHLTVLLHEITARTDR